MKAVKDDGTWLMYGAQDRAVPRYEGHHVRDEDAGRMRVLSRRRFVQEQYFRIRQQLRREILYKIRLDRDKCERMKCMYFSSEGQSLPFSTREDFAIVTAPDANVASLR